MSKHTPEEVDRALNESVEHWNRMATGTQQTGEEPGANHCALCSLFNTNDSEEDQMCVGCPIFEKTKRALCNGTPYDAAAADYYRGRAGFPQKAAIMRDWLIALRDERKAEGRS